MLIVLDTNVIVSGLLKPTGPPARLVDLVLSNAVQVAFDDRIISEYEEVLTRPPFGFPRSHVRALLDHIQLNGSPVLPNAPPLPDCPDPADLPFAEVAISASVGILVTGNQAHFRFLAKHHVRVLSPADFLREL